MMARETVMIDGVWQSKIPEYRVWACMVQRCTNPRDQKYHCCGAKGIQVWPLWIGTGGFRSFLDYIGRRPSDQHQISRINNDADYEPGNVCWVKGHVQKALSERMKREQQ